VKRLEILHELLTRNVPTIIVRQEVQPRRVGFRVTLEEDTEVRVADAAEHEARHRRGILSALCIHGFPPEQPMLALESGFGRPVELFDSLVHFSDERFVPRLPLKA
jgi:hypothetical protein